MREAYFKGIFVGIETPEADALKAMRKEHNIALPMMEAIETLNRYGLEVTAGIILGLDTDTPDTESRLADFIELSRIPLLTINLLQALPKTPLWERLARAGRITDDPALESNVRFLRPYDDVVGLWRRAIARAYDPQLLFARFADQVEATYVNRIDPPVRGRLSLVNLRFATIFAMRIIYHIGVRSDYWRPFWRAARRALARGQVDMVFAMAFVGHHLIEFTREALRGEQNASFYSARQQQDAPAHAPSFRKSA